MQIAGTVVNEVNLTPETCSALQDYVRNARHPFIALRHLHRAKEEQNSRYKWIEATIAAELAIKEFLLAKHPALGPLLLEMPAPPLSKLYGSLLKEYGGEESPKKRQIEKGAEMRNRLVHRPESIHIDPQKALDYVNDVEVAIFHLLWLLHPADLVIKKLYLHRPIGQVVASGA